jgi:[ribosomal protein S5]-alanine N-acetyltransferase
MNSTIRPWTMQDLDNLVKYGNNPKIAKFMSDGFPNPYTIEKAKAFIENAVKDSPLRIFAIDVEGQVVGGIGIHPQTDIHRKNAELGYWLAELYWGKGIMTNAIKQIVAHGFKYFDIDRIFARPFGTNIASHRVLEKAGFTLEARFEKTLIKNGEYLDELIYAVRRA